MNELIDYISRFGDLNHRQMDFTAKNAKEVELRKGDYSLEAGKVLEQVGFIIKGVVRICYYEKKGQEITKIFLEENHLILNMHDVPSSEYILAATDCRLLVFSNKNWQGMSNTVIGWEHIVQKIISENLTEKLEKVSPLISQDATTRYREFMEKYPNLVNRIPLSYVASYLGITRSSLSRIRRNIG